MSEERRKRCLEYKNENDRMLLIASDMLVKTVISEATGEDKNRIVMRKNDKGKPYIEGISVNFNFSHSGDFVVLAVNRNHPVGVDIEKIRPVKKRLIDRVCTEKEKEFVYGKTSFDGQCLSDKNMQERFFRIWTYKEAKLKCTGQGISDDLKLTEYSETGCFQRVFDDFCVTVVTET